MSQRQPEGWTMAFDCWTDLVTRGMAARGILGGRGYADYERQPAARRKQWLLGRIAVKDAVRFRQWEAGHTDVFPIELTVLNEESGRPRVLVRPDRGLIECDVSLAHTAEIGVAIAKPRDPSDRPDAPGVGIDVAEVVDRPAGAYQLSLSEGEQELLDSLAGTDPDTRRLWFARFWVAKEAVGKAEGTGLDGRPRDFVVTAAAPDELTVQVNGRRYRVESREVHNPEDLPARRYVVGWTWGPQPPPAAA
jgi:phosphopantetheinyl transferase